MMVELKEQKFREGPTWPRRRWRYFAQVGAIVWKDVVVEYRSKGVVLTMAVFTLLVLVLFNFAFGPGAGREVPVASGILWTAFLFAAVLGMNHTFALEKEGGCMQGLLLSPIDRSALFLGKMLGNLVFLLVVEAVSLPLFGILYNLPLPLVVWTLAPIVLLATVGLGSVGSLFASIAVNTKAREVMLPLLFFPVAVPVLIAAVRGTAAVLAGEGLGGDALRFLVVYDVVFLVASLLVAEYVLEE
jgi:heme exporter protein B